MSPEAQRIAIGQACGWTQDERNGYWISHSRRHNATLDDTVPASWMPEYLKDLNVMHKVEETADYHAGDYVRFLQLVTSGGKIENMTSYNLLHATAAQRAEAFLRTVGKYEGQQP